ncbi:hypothetical protein [Herbidospora mongoliensis]|uniref:hypothetical protein n=1 Tax=Herbidospora mongoliensis TaxID=688067 RepID=UPI00082C26C1|nr:hypothetical protein [Herbidospora mongoliensis]
MPVIILVVALTLGAGFGALTSLANALSAESADLGSREYTTSGWSVPEIMAVILDSGWAWAGLAITAGWLLTRGTPGSPFPTDAAAAGSRPRGKPSGRSWPPPRADIIWGAVVGPVALLAATAAYALVDTARSGAPLSDWIHSEPSIWWIAAVVFGAPLGVVGACVHLPGVAGLLAKLTLPAGAAVQMAVLPPGRNEVVQDIGQAVVWTAAALFALFVIARTVRRDPARRSPDPA